MKILFIFFVRLFCCLVAAKLFLVTVGWPGLDWLIGFTLALTANLYFFDFLEYRDSWTVRRRREKLDSGAAPAREDEEQ
jgi:uncharacterized membrane protein YbhN (UPF0104 family)